MYILEQAAACRRNLGDLKEAAEVYEYSTFVFPSRSLQMLTARLAK